MKLMIALAAGLAALGGAADSAGTAAEASAPPAGRQCFYTRDANNFRALDAHFVNIRVGVRDVWRFEMFAPCHDIDWNESIALVSRTSSWICSGLDADIVTRSPIGPQRCAVRAVRKLTPAEVAALPPRARP